MREILNSIRNFFFYDVVADINLYTIISTILKFIFVFIVLYYIYIIVRLIVLDIGNIGYAKEIKKIERNYLIVSHENENDRRYLLENLTKIGRSFSNDIVLESQIVSAQHAEIVKSGDAYYIIDLDSSNGTILNGEIINDNLELLNGDIIEIADYKLRFIQEKSYLNDNNDNFNEGGY